MSLYKINTSNIKEKDLNKHLKKYKEKEINFNGIRFYILNLEFLH